MKKVTGLQRGHEESNDRHKQVIASLATTHQDTLEQAFWVVKKQAACAKQVKAAFMANMRHDIKTPLSGIVGYANLLKEEMKDNNLIGHVDNLLQSSHALLDLFDNILEVTQVTSSQLTLLEDTFDLKSVLESIIQLNLAKACEKRLSLTFDYDKALPLNMIGDPKRIHRIILELVANALKFTVQGKVNVAALLMQNREQDVIVEIRVEDTGIGIPVHEREAIFEPFRRLTPSYEGNYSGLGLGLATVKQFLQDIGGEISVESELQKGSVFTSVLPLKKALAESVMLLKREASSSWLRDFEGTEDSLASIQSPSILLVEDQHIAATMVKSLLKALNCCVDVVVDGLSAIEQAKNHRYDLLILDVGLPDLSGIEVTRHIRAQKNTDIPIVALTAHGDDMDTQQQCIKAGMNAVFSKPLLKETAIEILNIFVPQYAALENKGK